MPEVIFEDAQQAAGFVTPALYRTHAAVLQTKYPSFDYAGLVPVNTEGDMWDIGTLVYSGDIAGAAEYISRARASTSRTPAQLLAGHEPVLPRGRGYELSLQEVNRASRMNLNLGDRKASAARLVAEKFVYDRVISGSTEKNTTGLVNNASVPTANATNGSWGSATAAHILADVNQVLGDVITNSGETAMPDALLLPTTRVPDAEQHAADEHRQLDPEVHPGQQQLLGDHRAPLDIRPSRELETAGASSTKRMIAYEKSPDNMEFFLPGMFEFLSPFAISSMSWRVDGIMNVGQLEIYRPKTVSYRDGI
jgi:hypothetical protein